MHPGARALTVIFGIALISTFVLLGYNYAWTGFSAAPGTPAEARDAKNLWDWLDLLIVPIALALGAYFLENTRQSANRKVETDRQRQQTLEDCINKISELSLSSAFGQIGSPGRNLARTRVLTALKVLDGGRKSQLLQFLYELGLISNKPIIILTGADFSDAELDEASLTAATIHGAYFTRASIKKSNLDNASLIGCDFSDADFSDARLTGTNLTLAQFARTNFSRAALKDTIFYGCKLEDKQLSDDQKRNAISLKRRKNHG
jgi:uncharacterized protein YjbI with pentapeptide repeats